MGDAYLVALATVFIAAGLAGIWAGLDALKHPGAPPVLNQQVGRLR